MYVCISMRNFLTSPDEFIRLYNILASYTHTNWTTVSHMLTKQEQTAWFESTRPFYVICATFALSELVLCIRFLCGTDKTVGRALLIAMSLILLDPVQPHDKKNSWCVQDSWDGHPVYLTLLTKMNNSFHEQYNYSLLFFFIFLFFYFFFYFYEKIVNVVCGKIITVFLIRSKV